MINKPDDQQALRNRARRYVRGIAVAVSLTFAALLFFYATLYGETSEGAATQPDASAAVEQTRAPRETSSISTPSALATR